MLMNPDHLGDSSDIVKRFFCEAMRSLGYAIYIDPMWSHESIERDGELFALLGVSHVRHYHARPTRSCLLIDPDVGIAERGDRTHLSFERIAEELKRHSIVFALDQSFSRSADRGAQMTKKLAELRAREAHAFYYDSHARFLFASRNPSHLESVKLRLRAMGLPEARFFEGLRETSRPTLPVDAAAQNCQAD